jgi:hypothetical protein
MKQKREEGDARKDRDGKGQRWEVQKMGEGKVGKDKMGKPR